MDATLDFINTEVSTGVSDMIPVKNSFQLIESFTFLADHNYGCRI